MSDLPPKPSVSLSKSLGYREFHPDVNMSCGQPIWHHSLLTHEKLVTVEFILGG